jgi:hypothetical protein
MPTLQLTVFLNAVRFMASPASIQIRPGQVSADEVALEWDNAWQVATQLWEEQIISTETYEAVRRLNQELNAIEPMATFWSDEALRSDERWEAFRGEAQIILTELAAYQNL